jgi:hypothetical protein
VPRALCGGGNEELRTANELKPRGMMLTDPGFVKAQFVEQRDELEVALET